MKRILSELQLDKISAVDYPCQELALATITKRDFSDEAREKLADTGAAMPDGSFPIKTPTDLLNAIKAFGRASDPAAVKRHIIRRARALGATDQLPVTWKVTKVDLPGRMTKRLLLADNAGFDSFAKAFDSLSAPLLECDGGTVLVEKLALLKSAAENTVTDNALAAVEKHADLYVQASDFLATLSPADLSQYEKSLDVSDRIHSIRKRIQELKKTWTPSARQRALEARRRAALGKQVRPQKGATHTTIPITRGTPDYFDGNPTSLPALKHRVGALKQKLASI